VMVKKALLFACVGCWTAFAGGADEPFSFVYDGREYRSFEGRVGEQLKVTVERRSFPDFKGASWYTVWFENVGEKPSAILEDIKAIDCEFKGANPELRGIRGDMYTRYRPYVYDLSGWSVKVGFETRTGRATHDAFPYFNLVHGDGGTLLALGWAGTWKCDFESTWEGVRVVGENCVGFRSQLLPGEKMRTALVVRIPYVGRNEDDAMNLWRRWFLEYVLPRDAKGEKLKPISTTMFCGLNSPKPFLDGSDNEDYTTWRPVLERLVAERCVPDFHWFDAGWYTSPKKETVDPRLFLEKGDRKGHWWNTIGTWELDPVKWPGHTFRDYVRACKAAGMQTFVWFEPERVTMVDDLVKNFGYRPEWALEGKTYSNWAAAKPIASNIGDPECLKWTLDRILKMMRENEVDMYREDNNSNPGEAWETYDQRIAEEKGIVRQGAAENLGIQGHYALWDGIIADCKRRGACPFVDSCASGGGRNDLESMRRGFPIMRSDADRTSTGIRLSMSATLPKWIPYHGTMVKETVNEMDTPTRAPDAYVSRASFLPIYNYWGWYTNPDYDFEQLRRDIAEWRASSALLLKDFYVLTPWHERGDLSGWTAFAYHDPETGDTLLLAFRQEECPDDTLTVTLPFVKDPAQRVKTIRLEKPRSSYLERFTVF